MRPTHCYYALGGGGAFRDFMPDVMNAENRRHCEMLTVMSEVGRLWRLILGLVVLTVTTSSGAAEPALCVTQT